MLKRWSLIIKWLLRNIRSFLYCTDQLRRRLCAAQLYSHKIECLWQDWKGTCCLFMCKVQRDPRCQWHPIICHHLQRLRSLRCSGSVRSGLMDNTKNTAPVWVHQDHHHLCLHLLLTRISTVCSGFYQDTVSSGHWLKIQAAAGKCFSPLTWRRVTTDKWTLSFMDGHATLQCKHKCFHRGTGHFTQTSVHLQKQKQVQKTVWLHIVTTVNQLSIRGLFVLLDLLHCTSSFCCITNPSLSLWFHFFSFTSHHVSSTGRKTGSAFSVFALLFFIQFNFMPSFPNLLTSSINLHQWDHQLF